MPVSRGHALALSAALHMAGLGVAGWTTHGQYPERSAHVVPQAARAYTLSFLLPDPPKPRPIRSPRPSRRVVRPPRDWSRPAAPSGTPRAEQPAGGAITPHRAATRSGPATSALLVRELAPGATVAAVPGIPEPVESPPDPEAPAPGGAYRAAALVTPAGSACPALPLPREWDGREVSVAVGFVVDAEGKVDGSRLRIVESPGRPSTGRGFYPRIYVVSTRKGRAPGPVDPARYDALVTNAVSRHILTLRFRPARVGGKPVRSTVLVACHRSPGH
jgi:hypothetical protein